jgi:hypothetical protein
MAIFTLSRFSYPKVPGDEKWSIADVQGPTSYVHITPGTPGPPPVAPLGGQEIFPEDFGLQSFDIVLASASYDGLYGVHVIPIWPGPNDTLLRVLLAWYTLATGAPVAAGTNLSLSMVRLLAIGR